MGRRHKKRKRRRNQEHEYDIVQENDTSISQLSDPMKKVMKTLRLIAIYTFWITGLCLYIWFYIKFIKDSSFSGVLIGGVYGVSLEIIAIVLFEMLWPDKYSNKDEKRTKKRKK